MGFRVIKCTISVVLLLASFKVLSEETISYKGLKNGLKKFEVGATIMYSSNMYAPTTASHSASTITELSLTYPFDHGGFVSSSISATKDLENDYEEELSSLDLFYSSKKIKLLGGIYYNVGGALSRPLDEYSQEDESLVLSTALTNSFSKSFSILGAKGFNISFKSNITKNFHQYTVAYNGSSNTNFAYKNKMSFSYRGWENVSVGYGLSMYQGFTYKNNRKDPSYNHGISTSYSYKNYSTSLNVSTGGQVYRQDGKTMDVSLFEKDRATVFWAFGISV